MIRPRANRLRGSAVPMIVGGVIALGLLVFVVVQSLFVVREWEQVVLTQFGEIQGSPVTEAGLHFKKPFVQEVHRFERRLMRWDGAPYTIYSKDRRTIHLNITARWRIEDAAVFLPRIATVETANAMLYRVIEGALRDEIGKHDLYEVVRSSNHILQEAQDLSLELEEEAPELDLETVATLGREVRELQQDEQGAYRAGRPVVVTGILLDARRRIEQAGLGIHLEDILIKQLNYTRDIESNVYAQMNAELSKISAGFRAHGRKNAEQKLGEMERELASIESEAIERSQEIRGRAEAEAIRIYAEAVNEDPSFYRFLRNLEALDNLLGQNSALVISTDSDLFRFLKNPAGEAPSAAATPK